MKDHRILPGLMLAYVAAKLLLALFFPPLVAGITFFAGWRLMPAYPAAASIIIVMGIAVLVRYLSMFLDRAGR